MTTRLTQSSLASPITITKATTFSAPNAANAVGPFVVKLGTTSTGALATVNLKSIGDAAAAKTTLILPSASTDYLFKTASGAVTISTQTTNPTTHKVTTKVIASLDLTTVARDTPSVQFTDTTAKFHYIAATKATATAKAIPAHVELTSLALSNDTGVAGDGISSDGELKLVAHVGTTFYSTNGGLTYTAATGSTIDLSAGNYAAGSVKVLEKDATGKTVVSALTNASAITIDKTVAAPSVALASDTGTSQTDGITKVATVNVTGLETGATWQYSVNGADWKNGTGTSFTLPADGTYDKGDVQVRQTDKAGNESDVNGTVGSNAAAWTLDTTAAKLVNIDVLDTGTDGDYFTAEGKVTVNDLEAGATLYYSIDGSAPTTKATGNTFTLPNGVYDAGKIQMKQIDAAGNESVVTPSSFKLTVNDAIPNFDVIAEDGVINAEEKAAGVFITGDVKAGSKGVSISINGGEAKAATVNADGSWGYDLLPSDIVAPSLTIKATVTDKDGVVGQSDTVDVIVDLQAEQVTFNTIAEDGVISHDEKLAGVTISGTTEVGSTVAISIDGATEALATVVDGVWNYKLPDAQVKEGTISITATATDKAGNESVSTQNVAVLGQSVDIKAANTTPYDAAGANLNFYVAAGDYTYNIANFSAGDKIDFPAGNAPTVINTDSTDNALDLQYASDGKITVLHLTNLPEGKDAAIYSVNSFNTAFGTGSLTSTGSSSTPAPVATHKAVSAAGTASAGTGNVVFDFAAGNYDYSVSNFATGDGLNFPVDVTPTVINTDATDKKVDVQWASSGKVVTVSVTGLTDAQDGAIYSANSFRTLFGANSLTNTGEPPVTPTGSTLAVSAAGSANAGSGNVKFDFAAGNYDYTILGFSSGDVLNFPDDVPATVINSSTTDNSIEVQWASNGNVVHVTLTGLASDTAYSVNSFNAAFGAGSII